MHIPGCIEDEPAIDLPLHDRVDGWRSSLGDGRHPLPQRGLMTQKTKYRAAAILSIAVLIFGFLAVDYSLSQPPGAETAPPKKAVVAGKLKTHYRRPGIRAHVTGTSYTPPMVGLKYNFPNGVTGKGAKVGVIELGGALNSSDITTYLAGLGITQTGSIQSVTVQGSSPPVSDGPNGADGEVMLDCEVICSIAPGATVTVYFADNSNPAFLAAFQQARADGCQIISCSWGGPESSWRASDLQSFNAEFQSGANAGVSYFIAAGDSGSSDGATGLNVDFPGSSPYVICCGGTSLPTSGAETVWNDGAQNGATGGGISATFPKPSYQPATAYGVTSTIANRMVPDIAGNADPDTGYQTLVDGTSGTIGGTSAVAPLFASMAALYWEKNGAAPGALGPKLYGVVSPYTSAFVDITQGNNGSYKAGPGFDLCSGIGRPDGAGLYTAIFGAGGTGGGSGGTGGTPVTPPSPVALFNITLSSPAAQGEWVRFRAKQPMPVGSYGIVPVTPAAPSATTRPVLTAE
jgi:subtilase family serine protease